MALSVILGRRGRESGSFDPVSGRNASKTTLRATALAAREKSILDRVVSSVTMRQHRSAPNALPGLIFRCVTGISIYAFMT
jgi:hypothetical protein